MKQPATAISYVLLSVPMMSCGENSTLGLRNGEITIIRTGPPVIVDLLDADEDDMSVLKDAETLFPHHIFSEEGRLGFRNAQDGEEIKILYKGKGKASPADGDVFEYYHRAQTGVGRDKTKTHQSTATLMFNAVSMNEFEVTFPRSVLYHIHDEGVKRGKNLGFHNRDSTAPRSLGPTPEDGWDDRVQRYGTNEPITDWVLQRNVHLTQGGTGTLFGPRQVLTAAHAIYVPERENPWVSPFVVAVGKNGTSVLGEELFDLETGPPPGEAKWMAVPTGWAETPPTEARGAYDIGWIVPPSRLGETTGGWLGWWAISRSVVDNYDMFNNGYPGCDQKFDHDNDPSTPAVDATDEPDPCNPFHLYGDLYECVPGHFWDPVDGWYRNFKHLCDSSAGHSGGGIITNPYPNEYPLLGWGVFGITTAVYICEWTCEGCLPCNEIDAEYNSIGVRITPTYSAIMFNIRELFL